MNLKVLCFIPREYPFYDMYSEYGICFDLRYGFLVGKADKPTAEDRDLIRLQFDRAWKGIFGDFPDQKVIAPAYSLAVVQDLAEPEGSESLITFGPEALLHFESGGFYLVFVLKTGDPDSPGSEEEIENTNREITRMIADLYDGSDSIRAGVVTIINGTIDIIPAIA